MKILQVIHSVDPQAGGTTEALKQLSLELARQGVDVDVLSLDPSDAPWLRDFPLHVTALGTGSRQRGGYGYTPRALPWLLEHGRDYDFIVVNGLWQYGGFAVWRATRRIGVPYVVFPHGMLDPWFKRYYPLKHLKKWCYWPWGEYRVLRDAAAVLFTSEEERLDARQSFWLYRCREEIAGFGIESPPETGPELFLQKFPDLTGRRLLLFLGRLHEKKGCDLLLHAFHDVAAGASTDRPPHLVIAGPANNAYAGEMRDLASQLGLDDRWITWTGMVTGDLKWSAFCAADFFVLPSHQENFGVSAVEALACRCPVLLSNKVNIAREVAEDGAGLVENDDLPGTRRLLERWLDLDPAGRARQREAARPCFERRFRISQTAARFTALLEKLPGGSREM
jgi:glycosyltransferase involved in cell wall biosynthesis